MAYPYLSLGAGVQCQASIYAAFNQGWLRLKVFVGKVCPLIVVAMIGKEEFRIAVGESTFRNGSCHPLTPDLGRIGTHGAVRVHIGGYDNRLSSR